MKKLVSFLSAFVMMFTMITTCALADENNKIYFGEPTYDGTANTITLDLYLKSSEEIGLLQFKLDWSAAYNQGIVATKEFVYSYNGFTGNVGNTSRAKTMSVSYSSPDGAIFFSPKTDTKLLSVKFDLTNASDDFKANGFTLTEKTELYVENSSEQDVTSSFTNTASNYLVQLPKATEYTVTFKNGDTTVKEVKVAKDGKVAEADMPAVPAKVGYTGKWVANGVEFTTSTVITADTTVTAEYTYGTPIKDGDYAGKTLYLNEGTTTFNFGTDKAIQITKKVGETTESRTFGKKWLSEKTGVEGEGNTTFTLGIIDVNDLAKGTFTFKVLQSLE